MTLRRLIVVLLVANVAFWAWSQGFLRDFGLDPDRQREPERLAQQIHAQALQVRPVTQADRLPAATDLPRRTDSPPGPAPEAAAVAAPASAGTEGACLQAGPFNEEQTGELRAALATLPAGSWQWVGAPVAGRWMVYIGKLQDLDAVRARRAQLAVLGVETDRPGAAFDPGISLGRFSSSEAARRALADLSRKGVADARVVQERPEAVTYVLRLPQADAALRAQVQALAGKELKPCE